MLGNNKSYSCMASEICKIGNAFHGLPCQFLFTFTELYILAISGI